MTTTTVELLKRMIFCTDFMAWRYKNQKKRIKKLKMRYDY